MKVFSFRNFRIVILLLILASVVIYTQDQKRNTTSWYQPIEVDVFPINADGSIETDEYIAQLSEADLEDIDDFFMRNGNNYHLIAKQPVFTSLGQSINNIPPESPHGRVSVFASMWWSINMRYWALRHTPDNRSNRNRIRLYVLYHQPRDHQVLPHSLGLQKGLIGVVHAFADPLQNPQNALVMAHEIMHTVGATDKYDQNNQPDYPDGYADPDQRPLYPQQDAEIMAGRIPLSKTQSKMPASLRNVIVGRKTAAEIHWIKQP